MTKSTNSLLRDYLKDIIESKESFLAILGHDLFKNVLDNLINEAYEDKGYPGEVADALNKHFPESILSNLPDLAHNLREKMLLEEISKVITRVLENKVDIEKVEAAVKSIEN